MEGVTVTNRVEQLRRQLAQRILVLDGGMGTMIQSYRLDERDFRGERFADWRSDLKGNNDLLVLTKPEVITAIHYAYLEAGPMCSALRSGWHGARWANSSASTSTCSSPLRPLTRIGSPSRTFASRPPL